MAYSYKLTVYSWGRGEDGQLGIGDTSDQSEPTYINSLRGVGVKQIPSCSGHTVVLTGEGEVYTWGRATTADWDTGITDGSTCRG